MIYTGLNNTGEVEAIYGHLNGVKSEVSEVYGSIDYNDPIFYSRKTITGTSPLTFKGLGQPLKDYHIFGETIQNGTPSPDYPVDVQGVGEKTVNLLDMTSQNIIDKYSLNKYGSEVQDNFFCITDFLEIEPNTYYTINITNRGGGSHYSCFYDENKNFISSHRASGVQTEEKYTYLSPNNAKYIRCSLMSITMYPKYAASYMLTNTETIPPEYIPYGSEIYRIPVTIGNTTTPIYIGSDPLYRVGEYADEIRSDGTVVRKVIEQTLMGYGDPGGWSSWGNSRWAYVPPRDVPKIVNDDSSISNYYRKGTENQQYFQWYNYIGQMIGFFKDTRFNTITEFRDYVKSLYDSGNPLKIYYILETPTTEQVTVPSLSTIVGDNTLTVDTTVKPSAVSITGNIKPTGYGQLLDINDVDIQDSTGEPIYIQG